MYQPIRIGTDCYAMSVNLYSGFLNRYGRQASEVNYFLCAAPKVLLVVRLQRVSDTVLTQRAIC
jgi:hypothetical protein